MEQLEDIYYMDHICSSSKSFTTKFNYSLTHGALDRDFVKEITMLINERLNSTGGNNNETTGGRDDIKKFLRAVSIFAIFSLSNPKM